MARPSDDQRQATEAGRRVRAASVVATAMRHADHAEQVAAPAGLRAGQAAQRQDEEDAGDEIGSAARLAFMRMGPSSRAPSLPCVGATGNERHHFFFFWYIASMRWVTRKPPKMLTEANQRDEAERARHDRAAVARPTSDTADGQQRADDDHRGDGVGHRHQRRVQRRRHAPDHVVADEDRQHEDRQAKDERIDRPAGDGVHAGGGHVGIALRRFGGLARDFGRGLGAVDGFLGTDYGHGRLLNDGLRHEVRMDDGAVAGEQGRLEDLVVAVGRERLGLLVDQDPTKAERLRA